MIWWHGPAANKNTGRYCWMAWLTDFRNYARRQKPRTKQHGFWADNYEKEHGELEYTVLDPNR